MATIKQITKQIETATKRVNDYSRKVSMYNERTNKALKDAGVSVDEIITIDRKPFPDDYTLARETRNAIGFEKSFRITNNYGYMKENERNMAREQRNIKRLEEELVAMQEKAQQEANAFNKGLAATYAKALQGFKNYWFERMINWHTEHHAYINEHKAEAKARYQRAYICSRYFYFDRKHVRSYGYAEQVCRETSKIFTDIAAHKTLAEYLEDVKKQLNAQWENGLVTLTKKSQAFGVDENNIYISSVDMTEKGFEIYITDGKPRRIYARIIWAAEYSHIVEPHTRYIVTEKKLK